MGPKYFLSALSTFGEKKNVAVRTPTAVAAMEIIVTSERVGER